ncbi:cupin domain-containing protein [Paenibacillus chartarius]|uniref:Cupin domain-containing protein n=1 Tax=Paenibacillus chartarius TaxID=747481 RepID=A0ABV6DTN3_9BACL
MQMNDAQYWITKLDLAAHPEGGYYKRTYQSEESITDQQLSVRFNGERLLYTSIYFLLQSHDVSHFHRLKSDELWYFHAGSPLTIHVILEDGTYKEVKLGLHLDNGETPQYLVPKNSIFGSSVMEKDTFSLVGCMVAPGFDFQDFELFTQDDLLAKYPEHHAVIQKLAYDKLPVFV